MRLVRVLLVCSLLGVAGVATKSYLSAQTGCDSTNTPPQDPTGAALPGAPGMAVTVNIDPSFDSGQQAALETAFTNWQNSSTGSISGVTFTFTSSSTPVSGTGTYQVSLQTPTDSTFLKPKQAAAQMRLENGRVLSQT